MIIDFHTHIFPREMRRGRRNFFVGEPAFELLYGSPKSKMASAAEIVSVMDDQGVDKSVVFGFPWRDANTFKMHNDYVIDALRRYPDRLVGFACFDAASPKAEAETLRCVDQGLCGVGELAFYEGGIDETALGRLGPIMDVCRVNNLPIMLHTNEPVGHQYPGKSPNTLAQIYRLVKKFSRNRIVLAHWGGGVFFFNLLKREVKESLANIYFDTAASPFLYDRRIYRLAMEVAGPDKILFGSDYPLIMPERYFNEFRESGLTPDDIARISGGNAQRLLSACCIL